jgi:hypothetical protein
MGCKLDYARIRNLAFPPQADTIRANIDTMDIYLALNEFPDLKQFVWLCHSVDPKVAKSGQCGALHLVKIGDDLRDMETCDEEGRHVYTRDHEEAALSNYVDITEEVRLDLGRELINAERGDLKVMVAEAAYKKVIRDWFTETLWLAPKINYIGDDSVYYTRRPTDRCYDDRLWFPDLRIGAQCRRNGRLDTGYDGPGSF